MTERSLRALLCRHHRRQSLRAGGTGGHHLRPHEASRSGRLCATMPSNCAPVSRLRIPGDTDRRGRCQADASRKHQVLYAERGALRLRTGRLVSRRPSGDAGYRRRGRQADGIRACGLCHYPNGQGKMENGGVAGLPAAYILQQLAEFKSGIRQSADPRRRTPTRWSRSPER